MSSIFEALGLVDKKKAEQEADACIAATGQMLFDDFLKKIGEDKRIPFMAGLKAAFTAAFASNQIKDHLTGSSGSNNQVHGAVVGDYRFNFKTREMRDKFQKRMTELAKELGADVSDLNQKSPFDSSSESPEWLNNLMFGRRGPSPLAWEKKNNGYGRPQPEPAAPAAGGTATTDSKPADPVVDEATAQRKEVAATPLPSDTELSE